MSIASMLTENGKSCIKSIAHMLSLVSVNNHMCEHIILAMYPLLCQQFLRLVSSRPLDVGESRAPF